MSAPAFLAGAALLFVTLAGCGVIAGVVAGRRLAHLRGIDRAVAVGLLFAGALLAVHVLALMAGVLSRFTVPALAALCAALAARLVSRAPAAQPEPFATEEERPSRSAIALASTLVCGATALAVATGSLAYMLATSRASFTLTDIASFHLPNVARWIQTGSLWQVDQFIPYLWQGNYPQSGDVMLLAAVLPWHSDFAARYVQPPFVALMALAVYALARELRAPRPSAAAFAAVSAGLPIVALSAYAGAMPDAVMYATFAGGGLFLLRFARTRLRSDLALAGLGLGICFGVKWYSLTSVAAVLVVWAAAELAARRGLRTLLRDAAQLVALILVLGGVWLVRNLLESGDPLFPTRVRLLGLTLFDAPPDLYRPVAGFRVFDYVGHGHVWSTYISPAFTAAFRRAGEVLAAGGVLAAVLAVVRRGLPRAERARVLALAACGLLLTFAYFDTPYSALGPRGAPVNTFVNTRYWVPALLCAAPLCAWLAGRAGRLRLVVELAAAGAAISELRRGFTYPGAGSWVIAIAVTLVVGFALLVARGRPHRAAIARRRSWLAGAVAAAGLGAFFLYVQQRAFLRHRYERAEPALSLLAGRAAPARVGLVGVWDSAGVPPILPAFGPRLRNRVEFVGPVIRHTLLEYRDPASLAGALARGRYGFVLLGRAAFPGRAPTPPAWVQAAGYRLLDASPRLELFVR